MDKILEQIKNIINDAIKENFPDLKPEELEENGAIYYMNGKNGTEFDYYINKRLSSFMVFYDDKGKLGAVKLIVFSEGNATMYLYNEKGKNLFKTINTKLDASKDELLQFAIMLRVQMDDKHIWDDNINKIDTSKELSEEEIKSFTEQQDFYTELNNQFEAMDKLAMVSKRILDDGYKVGYMGRVKPNKNNDSGWRLFAGNEDDAYADDPNNFLFLNLRKIIELDPDILKYIGSPAESEFIRISSSEFVVYNDDREIFVEKR